MSVLNVRDLIVTYVHSPIQRKVLDNLSLEIGESEIVGLVGESGSGKTTLALTVLRLNAPEARIRGGEVLFEGKNLLEVSDKEMRAIRGNKISIIFQDPRAYLNPYIKVGEQVMQPLLIHKKAAKHEAKKLVLEAFQKLQINMPELVFNKYPHQISTGMCQRAVIAMATLCKPSLLIADEPTSALDVTTQAQIFHLLKKLKEEGTSILLITHDLGVVAQVTDRMYLLHNGRILEAGPISKVLKEPVQDYTKKLLNAYKLYNT